MIQKHLTYQLVVRIVILSTFLAAIATAIQLYFDFRVDAGAIRKNVDQISTIHSGPLSEALWSFNSDLAMAELNALQSLQGIEYLEIVETGLSGLRVGAKTGIAEMTEVSLTYTSDDKSHFLGTLIIGANFETVYDRLLDKFLVVLATNSLKLFAVSVFMLLLLKSLVTSPINGLTKQIRQMDVDGHLSRQSPNAHSAGLANKNEIGEIENAILNLQSDLSDSYESLKRANDELENRVTERTKELNEAREKAEELARTDPLTGVNNRRAFFDYAERIHKLARRSESPYAVLMIDLDLFKRINDKHGHAVGDDVLKAVADILNSRIRESDVLGRLGGEEFAVLLPDTSPESAGGLANEIRQAVARSPIETNIGAVPVTISIGVGCMEDMSEGFQKTLTHADDALYAAKEAGRNLVMPCIASA